MRKWISVALTLFSFTVRAQTYLSLAPSVDNIAGTFAEKANMAVELGRQWDVFSLGIDYGRTSLAGTGRRDTASYLELRPNLNVFQQGKFTNTFTAGIGYVFNAENSLMTELTSGIEYSYSTQLHFNVYLGQYYYSGRYSANTFTFFGLSAAWYFKPTQPKPLIRNNGN